MSATNNTQIDLQTVDNETLYREVVNKFANSKLQKCKQVKITKNFRPNFKKTTPEEFLDAVRKYGYDTVAIQFNKDLGNCKENIYHAQYDAECFSALLNLGDGTLRLPWFLLKKIPLGSNSLPLEKRLNNQRKKIKDEDKLVKTPSLVISNVLPNDDSPLDEGVQRRNNLVFAMKIYYEILNFQWITLLTDMQWNHKTGEYAPLSEIAEKSRAKYGIRRADAFRALVSPLKKSVIEEKIIEGKYFFGLKLQRNRLPNVLPAINDVAFARQVINKSGKAELLIPPATVEGAELTVENCHQLFKRGLTISTTIECGRLTVSQSGTSCGIRLQSTKKYPASVIVNTKTIVDEDDNKQSVTDFYEPGELDDLLEENATSEANTVPEVQEVVVQVSEKQPELSESIPINDDLNKLISQDD